MKVTTGGVLRNSAAVFIGTLIQKLISLYTLRALATGMDRISPQMFSDWNTVFIFLGFFGIIADFNLDAIIIRELSRKDHDHRLILGNALFLKFTQCVVALAAVSTLVWFTSYPLYLKQLILLAALSLPFSMMSVFRSLCQARFQSHVAQVFNLLVAVVTLVVMLTLLRMRFGLAAFVATQAFIGFPVYAVFIYRAGKILRPSLQFVPSLYKHLWKSAVPLGLSAALAMVYYRFDALYLSWVRREEVGLYAACYRLTEAFSFVPGAVMSSVYPALASLAEGEQERMRRAFSLTARWLLVLALPILVTTLTFSEGALAVMYGGRYEAAAPALRWLGVAETMMFLSPLAVSLMLSLNMNRQVLVNTMCCAGFNVILNLIFVPRQGFIASAAITAGTEFLALALALFRLRATGIPRLPAALPGTLLAGIATAGYLFCVRGAPPWIGIMTVLPVYALSLFLLRALTREDIRFLAGALRKK